MKIEHAAILSNNSVTDEYRVLCLDAPVVADLARPGQFVHIKIPALGDIALRRPFSIYMAHEGKLSVLYKIIGRGTAALAEMNAGQILDVMGPLGNGFPVHRPGFYPVLVAGGYGVAPLYLAARKLERNGILFVGGASAKDILCVDDFLELGWQVRVATEDGSIGTAGLVTDVMNPWLKENAEGITPEFFACGPDGMLKAVGQTAMANGWKAWLSLDRHMGCGVGACLACVTRIRNKEGKETWDRVCTDGPVFRAEEIVWQTSRSNDL